MCPHDSYPSSIPTFSIFFDITRILNYTLFLHFIGGIPKSISLPSGFRAAKLRPAKNNVGREDSNSKYKYRSSAVFDDFQLVIFYLQSKLISLKKRS